MGAVNKELNKGTNVTEVNGGVSGMLDFDLSLAPFLLVGARAGYLYDMPGSASYNYVLYTQTKTLNAALIPVEVGVSANVDVPSLPISLMAGIYGGYGFAYASVKNDINVFGQTSTYTQPYDGRGMVGELLASVNFKLNSALSFNINGGYRVAKVAQMKQTQDVSYNLIPGVAIPVGSKGDVMKDSNNNDLEFDYSGLNLGVGLSIGY
jgi:hypothetical protein